MSITLQVKTPARGAGFDVRLRALAGVSARVGLFDEREAAKGAAHEFGTEDLPARPWMSAATDAATPKLAAEASRVIGAYVDGNGSPESVWLTVGDIAETAMRELLLAGQAPGAPLAPETVDEKNSTKPLVRTGAMAAAITTQVGPVKRGEE